MHGIFHKIHIDASPEEIFQALTTESGLSSWWTKAEQHGNSITLSFGPNGEHKVVMLQLSVAPNEEVRWLCSEGPWEEKGEFKFSISKNENGSYLNFSHVGWPKIDDFYKHCNAKWGYFLVISLKQYLETGVGAPHPQDPSI